MSDEQKTKPQGGNRWLFLPAILVLGGAVAFTVFYKSGAADAFALSPGDATIVAQGQAIYQASCASCHGNNLEGQANWQKRNSDGMMPAPPHDVSGHTWHHASELLFKMTKFGPAKMIGNGYKSDMPAFENVLSDEQTIAVLSYIKSKWPVDVQKSHDKIDEEYKKNNSGS